MPPSGGIFIRENEMKVIAKPTGPFMLVLDRGEVLFSHRPSVVTMTDYLEMRVVKGEIKVLTAKDDLPDTASDSEFNQFWEDSNRDDDLAVKSFASKFAPAPAPEPQKVAAKK